ncbi:hypothetical protein BJF83_19620 [Nocardiopsis sp. CNR-923]|nr:hypothetical protein BJF83_19620 [Nocardiopsis sp. CNR-923]
MVRRLLLGTARPCAVQLPGRRVGTAPAPGRARWFVGGKRGPARPRRRRVLGGPFAHALGAALVEFARDADALHASAEASGGGRLGRLGLGGGHDLLGAAALAFALGTGGRLGHLGAAHRPGVADLVGGLGPQTDGGLT